ncbi:iron complex transport system substrate-binding protein [Stackebrandtia albiflava]|uniref:Iron complex transport system substrate-binding protein n=1 Tax=Stackebrandtia albiflava TaxID=406432 RepID=A0A562URB7_9ACTN|nr:ABC transporter substrate-binding protein [Stackebrandtia albiflava]TWJ08151.1 iron complex transport system substrate-binding protein [Stackebrandtia albiflava]
MKRLTALAVAAVATVALAACGTTEEPADENSATGGDPITVTDERGVEVTLDGPAVKVGATEWNVVEYLVSLGIQPTAVSDVKGFQTWDNSVQLDDSVTDIGTRGEPNLDTLAPLGLDVMFVTDSLVEGAVEQIEDSGVPVIVMNGGDATDPIGHMWKNVDLVAEVTGTQDAAADLKDQFDTTLAEAKEAVAATDLAGTPVAFADGWDTGEAVTVRPFTSGSQLGAILAELGLPSAWEDVEGVEGDAVYGLGQTDVEGLTKLPEDAVFWYIGGADESDVYADTLADNAIWQSLQFVKDGEVERLPDGTWMFGGPAAMTQFIDAVVAIAEGS